MAKDKTPVTPAVRMLREGGVAFVEHPYKYEEKGGTAVSARELGVDEHCVIKTLVMEDERKKSPGCVDAWRPAGFHQGAGTYRRSEEHRPLHP